MSDAVTALQGASFEGMAKVEDAGLRGMITVRGDLAKVKLKNAVTGVAGVDMPGQRCCNVVEDRGIAWMSPDELLVMVPYEEVEAAIETMGKTMKGLHFMAENVSDARAVFTLSGPRAREALAKLAPVDLSPEAFGEGEIRRTRIAQVAAAFWMSGAEEFTIVCFRSVAQYMFDVLCVAAADGSEVDIY